MHTKRQSRKTVKHTQTIRRQFPDELFDCVWPFCWAGAYRVKLTSNFKDKLNPRHFSHYFLCVSQANKTQENFRGALNQPLQGMKYGSSTVGLYVSILSQSTIYSFLSYVLKRNDRVLMDWKNATKFSVLKILNSTPSSIMPYINRL